MNWKYSIFTMIVKTMVTHSGSEAKILDDNKVGVYFPIFMEEKCLKCHGKIGSDVSEDFYAKIKEKYPDDEAFNYNLYDFRGMWSITMDKI
ncbi:MAG: DUF3365 domain-containing protein [Saprospiraceae bacterium]